MTGKEHNKLVGIFLMVHGGLQAFVLVLMCLIYGGIGVAMLIGSSQGEGKIVGVAMIGLILVLSFIAVLFIGPQVLGGYKVFKEKSNARTWGIVGSIISCLSFPLGTAVGVYGLWFFFGEEGKRFYLGGNPQYAFQNPPEPPPPNSWQ